MGYQLIEHIEVGSGGAASIEFAGIDGTGQDLMCLVSPRVSATGYNVRARFNSDSGSNYAYRNLYGTGSSVASQSYATQNGILFGIVAGGTNTSDTFASVQLTVPNYSGSSSKTISSDSVSENNATQAYQQISAGSWTGTAAITTLTISVEGTATFSQYSTASLYKITAD
jgi:hypothetical protein